MTTSDRPTSTVRARPVEPRRPLSPRVAWWYVAIGLGLAVAFVAWANDTARLVCYVTPILSLVPAAVIAGRRNRAHRTVWLTSASMAVCFLLTELVAFTRTADRGTLGAGRVELVANTAGELLFIGALVAVAGMRKGREVGAIAADATIVALGAWAVSYVTLIAPALERAPGSPMHAVALVAYRPVAVVVIFMLAAMLFAQPFRPTALWLLAGTMVGSLVGDLGLALMDAGHLGGQRHTLVDAGYICAYVFAGAMLLHPSIRSLTEPIPLGPLRPQRNRILLTTASLIVPTALLVWTNGGSATDRTIRAVSAVALCLAVTLRVALAVRDNDRAQRRMLRNAQHDPLTGLPNRALLREQITEALDGAWRDDARPTVLFIDIDRFKNINDSLGHSVGDEVLRMLGRRLRAALPNHVRVGRISGDEFMAVDPTTRSTSDAIVFAERVLSAFHEPVHVGPGDMYVTASVGVAIARYDGAFSADELQRNADTAMYRAKEAGRNCVAVFDDSMHERVTYRLAIESGLHRALERRELTLHYQPVVDQMRGEVIGFEALTRWHLSDGRIVSPAEFIPIAEETGLIVPLGAWALLEALTQLRSWIDDGVCLPTATMSVNLSPRQLQDPNLLSVVDEALRRSGVPARQLWLEVTEGVMIAEPEQAMVTMRAIRDLGVRLAIDDFGTGYSSLGVMRRFPLERIKIDRSFVAGMADDESTRSLVHTIIAMADALALDVVAEGVESEAQLRILTGLGCYKAQGFLMSPPVPVEAMRTTIQQIERLSSWTGGMQLSWPEC